MKKKFFVSIILIATLLLSTFAPSFAFSGDAVEGEPIFNEAEQLRIRNGELVSKTVVIDPVDAYNMGLTKSIDLEDEVISVEYATQQDDVSTEQGITTKRHYYWMTIISTPKNQLPYLVARTELFALSKGISWSGAVPTTMKIIEGSYNGLLPYNVQSFFSRPQTNNRYSLLTQHSYFNKGKAIRGFSNDFVIDNWGNSKPLSSYNIYK